MKSFDEALESYDKALAVKPDYAEALNNRAVVLQSMGRMNEAATSYAKAIAIKPDYAEAYVNYGSLEAVVLRASSRRSNIWGKRWHWSRSCLMRPASCCI